MRMRKVPVRGEKYRFGSEEIQILKNISLEMVEVILASGKTQMVRKVDLNIPVIETKEYEKIK